MTGSRKQGRDRKLLSWPAGHEGQVLHRGYEQAGYLSGPVALCRGDRWFWGVGSRPGIGRWRCLHRRTMRMMPFHDPRNPCLPRWWARTRVKNPSRGHRRVRVAMPTCAGCPFLRQDSCSSSLVVRWSEPVFPALQSCVAWNHTPSWRSISRPRSLIPLRGRPQGAGSPGGSVDSLPRSRNSKT